MSKSSKFLPLLAMAVALSPVAANAWTGQLTRYPAAPTHYQVTGLRVSGNSQGRPSQSTPAPGGPLSDSAAQFAASVTPNEGG